MLIPHGTRSMECDATYFYSGLIQHDYLTNKQHHFKKMRGWATHNYN